MLNNTTTSKLQEMRLSVMARTFEEQLTDSNFDSISFEDRFELIVDREGATRKSNHLKRLIKNANFSDVNACVEDIDYTTQRNLDKTQIQRLATCEYINQNHNIVLLGATGSGKTYIACALGMAATRKAIAVKYTRLPELLTELAIARSNNTFKKIIQQYKKIPLLIIDEWLLYPLLEGDARDLLEITESRHKKASTIYCSQFDISGWSEKIGEDAIADAICDRIIHDSYKITIQSTESMRKIKSNNLDAK